MRNVALERIPVSGCSAMGDIRLPGTAPLAGVEPAASSSASSQNTFVFSTIEGAHLRERSVKDRESPPPFAMVVTRLVTQSCAMVMWLWDPQ